MEVNDNVFIIESKTKSINSVIVSRNFVTCLAPDTRHTF